MANNRAFVLTFGANLADGFTLGSTNVPVGGTYILFDGDTGEAINTSNGTPEGQFGSSFISGEPFLNYNTIDVRQLIVDTIRAQEGDASLHVIILF